MLEAATAAALDRCSAEFRNRVGQRPGMWFLAAQADIRCRSEFWVQERRRQEEFHASHPSMSSYNPLRPWNSVIRASANHQEFWNKEFDKPTMLYAVQGSRSSPARPLPPAMDLPDVYPARPVRKPVVEKKRFDLQRKDGRYFKSREGTSISFACVISLLPTFVNFATSLTRPSTARRFPTGSPVTRVLAPAAPKAGARAPNASECEKRPLSIPATPRYPTSHSGWKF